MQFFIVDPLLGGEDGPLTQAQIVQLIRKKKLKRKHSIRIHGRDGLFKAGDVFAKAFTKIEAEWESEAEAKRKKKQAAKEESRQEKLSAQAAAKTQKAIQRQASKRAADSQVGPYHGFEFAKVLFNVFAILYVVFGVISLVVTVITLVMALNTPNSGFAPYILAGVQVLLTILVTVFAVGCMMFLRNFIDWMLNVEELLIRNR